MKAEALDSAPLFRAAATIRATGPACDAMEVHLTEQQAERWCGDLMRASAGSATPFTFRGAPVYVDARERGYVIVPSTAYNDRAGSTGLRVEIEGAE